MVLPLDVMRGRVERGKFGEGCALQVRSTRLHHPMFLSGRGLIMSNRDLKPIGDAMEGVAFMALIAFMLWLYRGGLKREAR